MLDMISNVVGKDTFVKVGLGLTIALAIASCTSFLNNKRLEWEANRQYNKQYNRVTEPEGPLTLTSQSSYQMPCRESAPRPTFVKFPIHHTLCVLSLQGCYCKESLHELEDAHRNSNISLAKFKDYFVYSNKPCRELVTEVDSPDVELTMNRIISNLNQIALNANQMALKTGTPIAYYTKLWNELMLRLRSLLRIRLINLRYNNQAYVTLFKDVLQVIQEKLTNPAVIVHLVQANTKFDPKILERMSTLEKIKMVGLSIKIKTREHTVTPPTWPRCPRHLLTDEIKIISRAKRLSSSGGALSTTIETSYACPLPLDAHSLLRTHALMNVARLR